MKRILFGLSALLIGAFAAGCGDDGGGTSTGGSAGSAGTAGTGGSTGGSSTGGSNTGGSNTGGMGSGGSSTGGSNTGGMGSGGSGGGAMCGGIAGIPCGATEYCDYPDDICGAADGSGTCKPRPQVCPDNIDPVCACDGKVYNNECEANGAGADVSNYGGCQAPAGQFACGPKFCAKGQQYCQVNVSDVGGEPNTYGCQNLPAPCSQPGATCDCLANVPCGNMCALADGGFTVTCPGG